MYFWYCISHKIYVEWNIFQSFYILDSTNLSQKIAYNKIEYHEAFLFYGFIFPFSDTIPDSLDYCYALS